jgi:hypothetical protein
MEVPNWDLQDELMNEMEDFPFLDADRLANLRSTGSTLSEVLKAAELEQGDWLDEITCERFGGCGWPEDLTPVQILCLRIRFDWAKAVLKGLRHCDFPQVPENVALDLVTIAWTVGGFVHSHDNFLQNHLLDMLSDSCELMGDPGA